MLVNILRQTMTVLILIILFFLLTSLWGFYSSIRPKKFVSKITPKDLGLEYEEVSFVTKDDITLRGWFIPHLSVATNDPRKGAGFIPNKELRAKTIILLHGYPADKGNILPARSFLQQKYNLLLFDFRYLGQSEGKYSTAGAKEVKDLLAAIDYLKSRGIEEVGVWGFSMGGAVALMTAAKAPEIKAIVSESSYARLDLLTHQLYTLPVLRYPLSFLTGLWGKIFFGINIKDVSPAEVAKKLKIPVLIIHSENDQVIPFSHALLLKESLKNNQKAEFWFQKGLIHGEGEADQQEVILDFFERNLFAKRVREEQK